MPIAIRSTIESTVNNVIKDIKIQMDENLVLMISGTDEEPVFLPTHQTVADPTLRTRHGFFVLLMTKAYTTEEHGFTILSFPFSDCVMNIYLNQLLQFHRFTQGCWFY